MLTNGDQTSCKNKWSVDLQSNELFIVVFWNWSLDVVMNNDQTEFAKNQKNLSQSEKK